MKEESPWASYKSVLPAADTYVIKDWKCQEFHSLVTNNRQPDSILMQMETLYKMMDNMWDKYFSQFLHTQISNSEGQSLKETETSFSMQVKSLPWVPVKVSEIDSDLGNPVVKEKKELQKGSDAFVNSKEIVSLLSHFVSYLASPSNNQSTFSTFLGIRTSLELDFLLSLLRSVCEHRDSDAGHPRTLTTTLRHMTRVYTHLQENLPPKQLQDFLTECPVIFVSPQDTPVDMLVEGRMMHHSEVQWKDPSGLFVKYRDTLDTFGDGLTFKPTLGSLYYNMQDFFMRGARVQDQPNFKEYADLLVHITFSVPQQKALVDVLRLLGILGKILLTTTTDSIPEYSKIVANLKDKSILPAKGGRWVAPSVVPMIANDKVLERLFRDKEEVKFIDLGEKLQQQSRSKRGEIVVPL